MENASNRVFHKLNDDEKDQYKKDKKKFLRFIIRVKDDDLQTFINMKEFENINCCKKNNECEKRDKAKEYEFNIMHYDNSKAYEMVINHCVLITKKEYENEVKKILETYFDDIKYTNSGASITTQINKTVAKRGIWKDKEDDDNNIKYPICILSFKRANKYGKSHLTLTKYKINHYLFIEPSQEEEYKNWYDPTYCQLIVGPEDFSKQNMGSTTVRNYILDWGLKNNHNRVWMLDDNIKGYNRYYQGVKNEINSKKIFYSIEQYIEAYDNVGIASHNFSPFITENDCRACIVKNNKCYSSMCVPTNNSIRFRYKHQEDNLISMEYINKGYCTLAFNHILYDKDTSGQNKGGNREAIYNCKGNNKDGDGYKERFEYFEAIIKVLYFEKKLLIREGKALADLVKRSTTMKSKEYHAKCEYSVLKGFDNDIIKKDNYNEIIKKQKYYELELI